MKILVLGKEKSGRSSLLNGLLGFQILPTSSDRCTLAVTEINSCDQSYMQRISVEYFTSDEFRNLQNLNENIFGFPINREIDLLDISQYLDLNGDIFHFQDYNEMKEFLNSVITNPRKAGAVKKVSISFQNDLHNFTFFDVPGIDSPILCSRGQFLEMIETADIFIFTKSIKHSLLTDCELKLLEMIPDSKKKNLLEAITYCDLVESRENYNRVLKSNEEQLKLIGYQNPKIVPVCSILEFDSEKRNLAQEKLQILNGGESGLEILKRILGQFSSD